MADIIEGPIMTPLALLVPRWLHGYLPSGAVDLEVSSDYENGVIKLLPGPIIQIYAHPHEDSELIIGDLIPERGGIMEEILYFSVDDHLAPKQTAVKGEAFVYNKEKRPVFQALIVMNEEHQPEMLASLTF